MIQQLSQPGGLRKIREKLTFLAWRKFRIAEQDAGDILQGTIATYFEVRHRYPPEENHTGILVGIFNNKCLEHIDRSVREAKKIRKFCSDADALREHPRLEPDGRGAAESTLDEVVRREDAQHILSALADLRPEAREMFRLLVEDEVGRAGLIEHYGLNKNTLDTRLHVFRSELKNLLRKRGIAI